MTAAPPPRAPRAPCAGEVCITCSDEVVRVTVLEIHDDATARVDTGSGVEEVSVALVDAAVGDDVLVHAGEAIVVADPG